MPLDRLLSTSDVVSLHCPLTPETTHLINQTTLARMKRSAYLISAARGPIVDEEVKKRALTRSIARIVPTDSAMQPRLRGAVTLVVQQHFGAPNVA